MSKGLKAVAILATLAAALLPLYGDPRATPVTHAEWGRMLLRGVSLDEALPADSPASLVFSVLSWKSALAHRADRYVRADGVEVLPDPRAVRAIADPGELAYSIAVARGGDYRIRLRLEGQPAAPALVELRRAGDAEARESFSVRPPELPGWVEAGVARLDSGAWTASVSLPLGARLEYVEVAPPCVNAIEPLDGWRATDVTDDEDLAVTLLKAADAEQDLPPAQSPIEVPARRFQRNDAGQLSQAALTEDAFAIKAGARGLRAAVAVEVPEGGLYAVAVFGLEGQGQRWLADGCRNAVVCGAAATDSRPGWHVVLTGDLTAGQHVFTVTLGPGASIERLRLERKRAGGADYVAALRRLGFEAGPAGPVTRARAREAVEWLRQRRLERLGQECGDWDLSPTVEYAQQAGQEPTPGGEPGIGAGAPPPPRGGNAPPPLSPPVVPPQQPASPVEVAGS